MVKTYGKKYIKDNSNYIVRGMFGFIEYEIWYLYLFKHMVRGLASSYLYFFNQHPPLKKEVLKYIMSEVMISRRGGGSGGSASAVFRNFIIDTNMQVTVPNYVVNNEFSVRIFGGGAGGSAGIWGGGGGWMNNAILKLAAGEVINLTIGAGGDVNTSGGTTSFGLYLYASGGSRDGSGGAGGAGRGWQFGAGVKGDGGVWGGGGYNGNGGIYGGGGFNGNGGTYGGGGGVGFPVGSNDPTNYPRSRFNGIGGVYGGNGCVAWEKNSSRKGILYNAEDGINTIGWTNISKDEMTGEYFTGAGLGNSSTAWTMMATGGGGGFGGNGSLPSGGGYGSNGGDWGGGGGYGGDGGSVIGGIVPRVYCSGGGGYGKSARGGNSYNRGYGGGGGYYCPGGDYVTTDNYGGGGGGIMINNGVANVIYGNGGGGGISRSYAGKSGVILIQYYQML